MCTHDPRSVRTGSRLEDGDAHREDHRRWSRRAFVHALGLSAAAAGGVLSGLPVRTFARTRGLSALERLDTDRVLVLIQLNGGNDGLNTVIPFRQDPYFQKRPSVAIPFNDILPITSDTGLHPSLDPFRTRFQQGTLSIVQGVGYAEPNLSHFKSTDIWLSGRSGATLPDSGWLGRSLDAAFPDFDADPPDYPLAVQFGGTSPLFTLGPDAQMGMAVQSIELFERLATTGQVYPTDGLGQTAGDDEIRFARTVANDAFRYSGALQAANARVENEVGYPQGNSLASQLSIVSRLIRGQLGARVYHVSLGGFDTHSGQSGAHAALLTTLAEAVGAFLADLEASGDDERVMIATFSEFGRRVAENGSAGTDHGTSAPLFLFGPGVRAGLHGVAPNLADLDQGGNLRFAVDFRSVFGSLLRDWFGMDGASVDGIMGGPWPGLDLVAAPTSTRMAAERPPDAFVLGPPYPNPARDVATLPLTMRTPGPVHVTLHDLAGRTLAVLLDGAMPAGPHDVVVPVHRLPSGTYVIRAVAAGTVLTRATVVVR